ncbi:hypothetical protein N7492_003335 [Penicillium capsulatum]|uniref:Extracellular serine-rich protein n=1 Tax=Penicillium capsulatum TaxID=69766 RepID=A0A9W9IKE3_9EURO|nr:hypothetical protein N7492_003335 [Penicillium capsulatum]KAJ6122081.1 hypothetical protein N7512_004546 [Penicillium capsulatum]
MPSTGQLCRLLLVPLAWVALGMADSNATTTSESTSATASWTSTSTGKATHTIKVGPKTSPHAYDPDHVYANPGDLVVFEFYPTNHSVVKADYGAPCVPASENVFYSGAFDSFNQNNGQLVGPPPTWSLVVNDTAPTFFYCTAIDSCLVNGMVGAINPNSSQKVAVQKKKALNYPYMLVPGQEFPAEGNVTTTSSGSDSTSTSAGSSSHGSSGGNSLSAGAIAGIVVAAVVFVGILVALFFVLGRNRVYRQWMSSQDGRTERTARWALFQDKGDTWPNQKSELESNATKRTTAEITSLSPPNRSHGGFSPPPDSGSLYTATSPPDSAAPWSWDGQASPRVNRGPTELEAHNPNQI